MNENKVKDIFSPLVTIGIPIVKTNFLEKAIKCALKQTYANIEIVIVNNGKTKEIRENIRLIVDQFVDSRIKYFENESQLPIVSNWNKTLFYANGEFFSILCDDDYWEPTFIEELINLSIKYTDTNIFHTRVLIVNENDECINISPLCPEFETYLDFIYSRIKEYRLQYLSDFMVRTKSIKKIDGFVNLPAAWGSDDLTWFNVAKDGGVAYSFKPLYHYRDSSLSVTNTSSLSEKLLATKVYVEKVNCLINNSLIFSYFEEIQTKIIQFSLKELIDRRLASYSRQYIVSLGVTSKFIIKLVNPLVKRYFKNKYIL